MNNILTELTTNLLNTSILTPNLATQRSKSEIINKFLSKKDLRSVCHQTLLQELNKTRLELKLKRFSFGSLDKYTIHFSRDWEWPWAITCSNVQSQHKVLDVGMGCTPFLPFLASKGCECYAIDPDPKYDIKVHKLSKVTSSFPDYVKKITGHTIHFRQDNVEKIGYKNDFFDRVYCISVLEHVQNNHTIVSGIKEMARVLKPDGLLTITVDNDGNHTYRKNLYRQIVRLCHKNKLHLFGESNFSKPKQHQMVGKYNVVGMMFSK